MAHSRNVLIVDDRANMVTTLSDILEEFGYNVIGAHDGTQALKCIQEVHVDLAILDIIMPGINGVETFKEIKRISPGTAVIMMTGFAVEDLVREAIREGAYCIISKPFDLQKVAELIEDCFSRCLVLIADDQKVLGENLGDILRDHGYRVSWVENGYKAIDKVRERRYQAVFLDMVMPGLNGEETFLEIRKINPKALVILYSGYQVEESLKRCIEKGAYACFSKPFDPDWVIKVLNEAVQKKAEEN